MGSRVFNRRGDSATRERDSGARRAALALVGVLTSACEPAPAASPTRVHVASPERAAGSKPSVATESINPRLLRRFRPVASDEPEEAPVSAARIELGRMLWFDPRFSSDGTISCNSCHDLAAYGVDARATSVGVGGQVGRRNAPTVYNTHEHFVQLWDGRARDHADQAILPMVDPMEMASSGERIERVLGAVPEYRARFEAAFGPGEKAVTLERVAQALAAFERGLTTRSRWDDYLAGDEDALTNAELRGLRLFLDLGCVTCHTGPQVGASSFQRAGVIEPWPNQADLGRFEVTGNPEDKMFFKVPTLKNVARTAPYFHDGSSRDLGDAVRRMGRHQLGLELEPGEVEAIVEFLGAMTGELPQSYIAPPVLPAALPAGG